MLKFQFNVNEHFMFYYCIIEIWNALLKIRFTLMNIDCSLMKGKRYIYSQKCLCVSYNFRKKKGRQNWKGENFFDHGNWIYIYIIKKETALHAGCVSVVAYLFVCLMLVRGIFMPILSFSNNYTFIQFLVSVSLVKLEPWGLNLKP